MLLTHQKKHLMLKHLWLASLLLVVSGLNAVFAQATEEADYVVVVYQNDESGLNTEVVYLFRDEFYELFPGLLDRPLAPPIPQPPDNGDGGQQPEPGPCGSLADRVKDNQDALEDTLGYLEDLLNGAPYVTTDKNGNYVSYPAGTQEHKDRIKEVSGWAFDDQKYVDDAISDWGDCALGNN